MKITPFISFLILTFFIANNSHGDETRDLLITSGTWPVWSPLTDDEEQQDDVSVQLQKQLSEKLSELQNQHENAILLDLGRWGSPGSIDETAYDAPAVNFWDEHDYNAVSTTKEDFLYGFTRKANYSQRPPERHDLILSSVTRKENHRPEVPTAKKYTVGDMEYTLLSLTDIRQMTALPGFAEKSQQKTPAVVLEENLPSENPVFLMSDLGDTQNRQLLSTYPSLDLILQSDPMASPEPENTGSSWLVSGPPGTHIAHLRLTLNDNGEITHIERTLHPWADPELFRKAETPPLPMIGVSVPGRNRVAEKLGIETDLVTLDVHRVGPVEDITRRQNIYTYRLRIDDENYRLYRLYDFYRPRWIAVDVLVIINEDRQIRQIVTNEPFYPILLHNTRLGEAFQTVLEKDAEQWELPPDTIAGIEVQGRNAFENLRRVIELDELLYPDQN